MTTTSLKSVFRPLALVIALVIASVLTVAAPAPSVHAATTRITDEASCEAFRGDYNVHSNHCTFTHAPSVAAGDVLEATIMLYVYGLVNYGTVSLQSGLWSYGSVPVLNYGTINIVSGFTIKGPRANINDSSGIINVNSGGHLVIDGSTFTNNGTITINSGGTLRINGTLTNNGTITVACGGTVVGNPIQGTPMQVADCTPPDTTITASPSNPSTSDATFTFTGADENEAGVASFACQLDNGGFSACSSPQSYSGLANGSHTFQVRASDVAGNIDPTPASFTWSVYTMPTKQQCERNGWQTLTRADGSNFKNQGECIKYIETGK